MIITRVSVLVGALLLVTLTMMACGGSDSSSPRRVEQVKAEGTLDASMATAESADVSNAAREYASDWCRPLQNFANEFILLAPELEDSEGIGSFLGILSALEEPIDEFVQDVEDIQPPREFRDYHQRLMVVLRYAIEALRLMSKGGLIATFALGDPPPSADPPLAFANALVLECGEELSDFITREDFLDIFGEGNGSDNTPTEGREVALGTPIEISAGDLPAYLFDSSSPAGHVTVTFTGFEVGIASVDDSPYPCGGAEFAKGQFVAVFFSFENDLLETVQMLSVVNRDTKLQDDRGRMWERAEVVRSDLCVLEPNISAQYIDGEQIAANVGPGFSERSAIAFDIPMDATGLVLIEAITKARIPLE